MLMLIDIYIYRETNDVTCLLVLLPLRSLFFFLFLLVLDFFAFSSLPLIQGQLVP